VDKLTPAPFAPPALCALARIAVGNAQIAYLSATVPDALLLEVLP